MSAADRWYSANDGPAKPYEPATRAQVGRIHEVFRRLFGQMERDQRIKMLRVLCGYNGQFVTSDQLSKLGAGAFITWAFGPEQPPFHYTATFKAKSGKLTELPVTADTDTQAVTESLRQARLCGKRLSGVVRLVRDLNTTPLREDAEAAMEWVHAST